MAAHDTTSTPQEPTDLTGTSPRHRIEGDESTVAEDIRSDDLVDRDSHDTSQHGGALRHDTTVAQDIRSADLVDRSHDLHDPLDEVPVADRIRADDLPEPASLDGEHNPADVEDDATKLQSDNLEPGRYEP